MFSCSFGNVLNQDKIVYHIGDWSLVGNVRYDNMRCSGNIKLGLSKTCPIIAIAKLHQKIYVPKLGLSCVFYQF